MDCAMPLLGISWHLQSMAKQDGRLLHPLWTALFPVYTPLSIKPSMATLMDVMVTDPQPKVCKAGLQIANAPWAKLHVCCLVDS